MHSRAVLVWGPAGAPVEAVSWLEPIAEWDSGFCVYLAGWSDDGEDSELWCICCLLDARPEVGAGMDAARRFGAAAKLVDGEWRRAK